MNKNQCPKCQSPVKGKYVCDSRGEVIGKDLYCTKCSWSAVGNW